MLLLAVRLPSLRLLRPPPAAPPAAPPVDRIAEVDVAAPGVRGAAGRRRLLVIGHGGEGEAARQGDARGEQHARRWLEAGKAGEAKGTGGQGGLRGRGTASRWVTGGIDLE